MAWSDARKQVAIVEETLQDAHNFWVVKKKDDAIKMSTDTQANLKALKATLDQTTPDSAVVMAAAKEFATSCLGMPQGVSRTGSESAVRPQVRPLTKADLQVGLASSVFAFLNTSSIIDAVSFPVFVF